jgi:hypothetical protein
MSDITLDMETFERMQNDKPIAVYIKTIRAKVGVVVFNYYTMKPEDRILKGDTLDPKANKEEMTVKIYDEKSHSYFLKINKHLIEEGILVPYTDELGKVHLLNAITDEEIDDILEQPYFTLMNRIKEFTSTIPVERILRRAIELNKGVKTIDNIKQRLAEMQEKENLALGQKATLEQHYTNIEK